MRRRCTAFLSCAVWIAANAAWGQAAAAVTANDNALWLRRSTEHGKHGRLRRSWRHRGSLQKRATLTPMDCHGNADSEYCPALDSCVPDQDCTSCSGYPVVNKDAHQCEAEVPEFVIEHCGKAPSIECYTFAAGMMNCISGCSSSVQYNQNAAAMGSCISGLNGGCPAAVCSDVCNCKDGSCNEPCFSTCSRYSNCVLFGNGIQATAPGEFVAFYEECVFEKDPPAGYQAADCGCRAT